MRLFELLSREPDRLRVRDSRESAVAFEEERGQDAARLKSAAADWSQYRYNQRKLLRFPGTLPSSTASAPATALAAEQRQPPTESCAAAPAAQTAAEQRQ